MSVAIVTGASQGFGRALAEELARDAWDLVIDARHAGPLDAAAGDLRRHGRAVVAVAGDVADAEHRRTLIDAAHHLGTLRLLVNNASTLGPTPLPALADYPLDALAEVHRVNVVAPLGLVQLALPLLVAAGGAIVNVTSDAAVEGYPGWGGYGSSKAALDQLARVLVAELAERPGELGTEPPTRAPVRVYAFDPGDMRTQMHQDAFPGEDISDRPWPETVAPALLRLLRDAPPSGRYRAADLGAPA